MTVVVAFYSNADKFDNNSRGSRLLQFIGRRTLDIYMIHYFFIPNLKFMQPWLTEGNMIVPQLIIAAFVTVVIVSICLLISGMLRRSTTLESWLFGVKKRINA